ncbi:GIY-YIG nuclease family protein [Pontibacter russatus]|uniref:GIY-YIG nuclease family protein n=1 Tax=Pontibacter russatus TaxID=2694929 RepID=UPI00293BD2DB|nr:GIY-YIG nuclease family protein [Pontibacter russatus]
MLYVGVTNDLQSRIEQHKANRGNREIFAGRYYCYKLLFFERYTYVQHAIEREKELKLMKRDDKLQLIKAENPNLMFLAGVTGSCPQDPFRMTNWEQVF